MADAKICDRCGEYYPDEDNDSGVPITDGLYIVDDTTVTISFSEDDLSSRNRQGVLSVGPNTTTKSKTIDSKDLCEDCEEAFLEFWENGGGE